MRALILVKGAALAVRAIHLKDGTDAGDTYTIERKTLTRASTDLLRGG